MNMNKWMDEVSGNVVGLVATIIFIMCLAVGAFVVGGLIALGYVGYQVYVHRHDPPQRGPWSEPGDTAAFGWDAGLRMGEEVTWR